MRLEISPLRPCPQVPPPPPIVKKEEGYRLSPPVISHFDHIDQLGLYLIHTLLPTSLAQVPDTVRLLLSAGLTQSPLHAHFLSIRPSVRERRLRPEFEHTLFCRLSHGRFW